MKTLISAQTVRQALAEGRLSLPAGKQVIVTPEARELADKLGVRLDTTETAAPSDEPTPCETALANVRAAVMAKLPPDIAGNTELVEQIVGKVDALRKQSASGKQSAPCKQETERVSVKQPASTSTTAGIRLVKGNEVHLGVFPGAGAEKQVGIADVITAADGAPIAAGFMAWSHSFFPWTLDYDEIDLVLEGELHIRCGGQTFVGKPGDVYYIPKGSAIEFGTPGSVRFFYVTYPASWQG